MAITLARLFHVKQLQHASVRLCPNMHITPNYTYKVAGRDGIHAVYVSISLFTYGECMVQYVRLTLV